MAAVLAQSPAGLPDVDSLMAMPHHASRVAALRGVVTSPDSAYADVSRAAAAAEVLRILAEAGRTDEAVVRGFLEAALSDDEARRVAAIEAARAGGLPPSPVSAQIVERPEPEPEAADLDLLRRYRDRMLYKAEKTVISGGFSAGQYGGSGWVTSQSHWTVYQGATPLQTHTFAALVGDQEMVELLEKKKQNMIAGTAACLVLGTASFVGGLAMVADDNDNNDVAGLILGSVVGGVGIGVGLALPIVHQRKRQWVATAYDAERASALIGEHNDALREELGLSEDDVRDMELDVGR